MNAPTIQRRELLATALLTCLLCACRSLPARAAPWILADHDLEDWIATQRLRSMERLMRNIAPTGTFERDVETRYIAADRREVARRAAEKSGGLATLTGDRYRQKITPSPGSIAAAPKGSPTEPDYFFHWVRDSALVMYELANLYAVSPPPQAARYEQCWTEFMRFSCSLQTSENTEGLGEVRYNMDGTEDVLQWSRPQFDGAALRALALLHYAAKRASPLATGVDSLLNRTLASDLDYLALNWTRDGFDLWEEYRGHDFYAGAVQAAALDAGSRWARARHDQERANSYAAESTRLRARLEAHWLPGRGYYGFLAGRSVYWDGTERVKPGDNFDAAVVMAAVHSRLSDGRFSLLDERVLATAAKAEDLFLRLYPINGRKAANEGVLYGRYEGDTYYGGNPFVFITFAFAEAHYRIASLLAQRRTFAFTPLSRPFFERAMARAGKPRPQNTGHLALLHGLVLRGDDTMRAVRRLIPESGDLPEQFDKNDGAPASGQNLSWSHAALLAATDARTAAIAALVARSAAVP